ncbi:poly-gamma-glutamate biosynthesis protein PgsC/CapC [Micromonospora sp. U21]|uniref:poly-gamma-glutamate biosynthesis protein PgsC/CapC n=1 Tax=Micromonospora sp. U21 TaxID=2824899 RepID=UPI001B3876DF|nr:poly-gamma-glutamate biosynthesis protein PgsC/CapC [Micromonospora sp. U21]MBQ0901270.1 poly-gamma-glutamate biosynthesis protein PgsC/CapC [Micromonospora sp. U21]
MPLFDLSSELGAVIIAAGLLFGLVGYLVTNVSPAGLMVPGCLVLTAMEDARSLLTVVAITAVTVAFMKVLQRVTILYGKRLFAVAVLVSSFMSVTSFVLLHLRYPFLFGGDTLSFIIPGLMTYQLLRPRALQTLAATGVVSAGTGGVALLMISL